MGDHAAWVARGFCEATITDPDAVEHWCRLWPDHEEPHVADWFYDPPKQEVYVRWEDGPLNVEYGNWVPDGNSAA